MVRLSPVAIATYRADTAPQTGRDCSRVWGAGRKQGFADPWLAPETPPLLITLGWGPGAEEGRGSLVQTRGDGSAQIGTVWWFSQVLEFSSEWKLVQLSDRIQVQYKIGIHQTGGGPAHCWGSTGAKSRAKYRARVDRGQRQPGIPFPSPPPHRTKTKPGVPISLLG